MSDRLKPEWVSQQRLSEYRRAASGDDDVATRLYEWNARVSAALFEIIHHFEVLLRNSIVATLEAHGQPPRSAPGTPWVQLASHIDAVVARLKRQGKEITSSRVYAGLTFACWQRMFGSEFEDLWRHSTRHVFPASKADRSVVARYLESINQLRNRIAHHGSLVERDTEVELRKILTLASWIDPAAQQWMRSVENVTAVSARRPITPPRNVLLVAGSASWNLYRNMHQSVCLFPIARSFQLVDRVGFYAGQEVKPCVPRILRHDVHVDWNERNAKRLRRSPDPLDNVLGRAISAGKASGFTDSAYQAFIVSSLDDADTLALPHSLSHERRGRGSAFVRSYRYFSEEALLSAHTTSDLG